MQIGMPGKLIPRVVNRAISQISDTKIKRSTLSEEEKILRCNRLELLTSLVTRPIHREAINLLNWESMDSENANDLLKMSPPSNGA